MLAWTIPANGLSLGVQSCLMSIFFNAWKVALFGGQPSVFQREKHREQCEHKQKQERPAISS